MNKAVFKENIKRFWPISFAAFIAYFLSGPFTLLLGRDDPYGSWLSNAVSNSNFAYVLVTCAMTVAVAAAVYAYLFKVNSTVFMHSVPVSRQKLLISNAASGLTLCFAPVLLNTLVLFAIKFSGMYDEFFRTGAEYGAVQMWKFEGIIGWMLIVWVEIFFIFSICTLSAMISGNGIINVLTSIGLNLLTSLICLSAMAYGSSFLFGYTDSSMPEDLVYRLHPVLYYGVSRPRVVVNDLNMLLYILAAAVIMAVSYMLYTKRANEKAGDSYVFDAVSVIIAVLMVYMGASCIGLIFIDDFGYWGFVMGGVFSFFVGQLIIQKSFRIFNRKMLISLAASFIVMTLLLAGLSLDIFGVEKKIPGAEEVAKVRIYDSGSYGQSFVLQDAGNISEINDLHRKIIENKDEIEAKSRDRVYANDEAWSVLDIDYTMKNGKTISRCYSVPRSMRSGWDNLDRVYSSREVMSLFDSLKTAEPDDVHVSIYPQDYAWEDWYNPYVEKYSTVLGDKFRYDYGLDDLSSEEKTAVMQAAVSDMENVGLTDLYTGYGGNYYFMVEIEVLHPLDEPGMDPDFYNGIREVRYVYGENGKQEGFKEIFRVSVSEKCTETLKVIEEILEDRQ